MTTATFINRQAKPAQHANRVVAAVVPAFINAMPQHDDQTALLEIILKV
jgi:hypothetical protein